MTARGSRFLWSIALCLWLLGGPALAQPIWDVVEDKDGLALASRLLEADTATSETFQKLIMNQPGLTRRAFVVAVLQAAKLDASDPKSAQAFSSLAVRLATDIGQLFGDPEPLAVLNDIITRNPESDSRLLAYWDRHRANKRPLANDNDEDDRYWESPAFPSGIDEKTHKMMKPLLAKGLRIELAAQLSHPGLLISEFDSFDRVAGEVVAQLPSEEKEALKDFRFGLELTKLFLQADLGLIADLPAQIEAFVQKDQDRVTEAELRLAGFRAAARQSQWELADRFLQQAQTALGNEPPEPVLRFCLRTADYQLRRARGFQPTPQQALEEFRASWAILDGYTPKTLIGDDYDWPAGRAATKYWIDEFTQFPETREVALGLIWDRFYRWVMAVDSQSLELPGESLLWHQDEFAGHTAYFLALLDGFTYLLEATPETSDGDDGLAGLVAGLRGLIDDYLVNVEGELFQLPGQPRFELRSAGLIPELKARLSYLESLAKETPAAKRPECLRQARGEILTTENPEATVKYLILFGQRFATLGFQADARSCWSQALELAQKYSFVNFGAKAAGLLAQDYQKSSEWEQAGRYAAQAKALLREQLPLMSARSALGRQAAEQAWQATRVETQAAIREQSPEKAWSALSEGQQLQTATLRMEGQKQAQSEVRRSLELEQGVTTVAREVDRLKSLPVSPTRDQMLGRGEKLLADNRARYLTESRALRQKYADLYSRVLKVDPLSLADIKSSLPTDMAVIQYFPTTDALYIFLVTSEAFRLQQVDVGQAELEKEVVTLLRALRRATPNDKDLSEASRSLHQRLIAPLSEQLHSANTLLFIPTGRLNSLPFSCLEDSSGKPLAADKRIVELAKATDLNRLTSEGEKLESLVAFANATGDLPAATVEGRQISEMFPQAKLFTGKEATKAAFMQAGSQGQVLHLATHGEWNLEDSLQNYLALAGGEKVSQEEIFSLDLSQKSLVMLSACNTAMGEGQSQNYVASLAEAFWLAGSRSVVASLWAVNDESTSLLMTEFYKSVREGENKAEALRQAQMTVRAHPEFSHPYYWAGFVLFGDWR